MNPRIQFKFVSGRSLLTIQQRLLFLRLRACQLKKGFEDRIEDLENEKASLSDSLKKVNESINNLGITNEILQNKIETAEKEVLKFYEEKKENIKIFENESVMYKTKAKSLEKSLIAKNKKIENINKSLDTARDTIEELKLELSRHTTSKIKLEAGQKEFKRRGVLYRKGSRERYL